MAPLALAQQKSLQQVESDLAAARAEERVEGANRRLADIKHEIREMLEAEPDGLAAIAGIEPGAADRKSVV